MFLHFVREKALAQLVNKTQDFQFFLFIGRDISSAPCNYWYASITDRNFLSDLTSTRGIRLRGDRTSNNTPRIGLWMIKGGFCSPVVFFVCYSSPSGELVVQFNHVLRHDNGSPHRL